VRESVAKRLGDQGKLLKSNGFGNEKAPEDWFPRGLFCHCSTVTYQKLAYGLSIEGGAEPVKPP